MNMRSFLPNIFSDSSEFKENSKPLQHFRLLKTIDIRPILQEYEAYMQLQPQYALAENPLFERMHRDTKIFFLRYQATERYSAGTSHTDMLESLDLALAEQFPQAMKLVQSFAKEERGKLGRVKFAALEPGGKAYGHVDYGHYFEMHDRYHLALISNWERNTLTIGDETVHMKPGELWWYDNKAWHESENASDSWRVHLIFDVLPQSL